MQKKGYVSFVLHAHLPFIHHPESDDYLEESWLYEAISETYIPLLHNFQKLVDEGVKFRNVKTKQEQNIPLYDIIKNLPVAEGSEIPLVSKEILEGLYSAIYKNEDTSFFENINNPSSGNPSSSSMPHS